MRQAQRVRISLLVHLCAEVTDGAAVAVALAHQLLVAALRAQRALALTRYVGVRAAAAGAVLGRARGALSPDRAEGALLRRRWRRRVVMWYGVAGRWERSAQGLRSSRRGAHPLALEVERLAPPPRRAADGHGGAWRAVRTSHARQRHHRGRLGASLARGAAAGAQSALLAALVDRAHEAGRARVPVRAFKRCARSLMEGSGGIAHGKSSSIGSSGSRKVDEPSSSGRLSQSHGCVAAGGGETRTRREGGECEGCAAAAAAAPERRPACRSSTGARGTAAPAGPSARRLPSRAASPSHTRASGTCSKRQAAGPRGLCEAARMRAWTRRV